MTVKKYIPDLITSLNLLCGTLGVTFALGDRFDIAFCLMLLGAVFDFADGLAARALGAYSALGRELDSLADVVTFGVLPAVMLSELMRVCSFNTGWFNHIPLAIAVFSGLRLAKFNVDERQHSSFLGLPTPACAMLCGSLCFYVAFEPESFLCAWVAGPVFVPALTVILCVLLVCELPMFSLKFSKGDSAQLKRKRVCFLVNCLLCVAVVLAVRQNISLALLLALTVYILMNIVFAAFRI